MIQIQEFKVLRQFVDEMRRTSSSNDKKVILKKYKDDDFILKCLEYTYNPYKKFGVTSTNVKKYDKNDPDLEGYSFDDIFKLLDCLVERKVTGHDALRKVIFFRNLYFEHEELIYQILDKNLEIRAEAKLINKVIPNLIPEFNVALANVYTKKLADFDKEEWLASRKLDGCRCLCFISKKGKVRIFSRAGLRFETLDVLAQAISKEVSDKTYEGLVLDGEVCIVEDGKEDFTKIMKEIGKKNHSITNPKFFIFDALTMEEFGQGVSNINLTARLGRVWTTFIRSSRCEILKQEVVKSEEHLISLQKEAADKGYEGLILRKNAGYKGKRSNDLLKVKLFYDAEYIVEDVIFEEMRFLEDGIDVKRKTLSAVMIKHKGFDVKVGSGFSKEERAIFYKDSSKIIGKTIKVRYFEETTNSKDNSISLRFPTVKHIFGAEGRGGV